jgi:hypothetical protein
MRFERQANHSFTAAHHSGEHSADPITIVWHQTQGATAGGAASWFANPESKGSAHVVGDGKTLYRTLSDKLQAWGVGCFNDRKLHYEMVGVSTWARKIWFLPENRRQRHQAAWKTARWCIRHKIRPRFLNAKKLRQGERNGITTHAAAVKAGVTCSTHFDPGKGFPIRSTMKLVKKYVRELEHGDSGRQR